MRWPVRPSVRLRLTLLYGGLFLLAGALLLVVNYGLVRSQLPPEPFSIAIEPGTERLIGPAPAPNETHDVVGPFPLDSPEGRQFREQVVKNAEAFRDATLRELVVQSVGALGLMAVVSVGMGWLMAGRVLRPLHHITEAAQRLSEENLHEPIAMDGPDDELKQLADTFDAMLGRLDAAFESQRRFIANASHELRTPLAIQRTLVDVALSDPGRSAAELQSVGDDLRAAIDRSERLIDALLVLARSERGVERMEPVDLVAAAADAIDAAALSPADGGGAVRIERVLPATPVVVHGEPSLLERVVSNLVENAVRHNVADGWARVSVSVGADGASAVVQVSNSGPVVPADEVDGLFEPFRRGAVERTESARGAGLGLSIVRTVVEAHGGSVHAAARPEGGLTVTATLPARRPSEL